MDREALVLRNKAMAEAFHKLPLKHQVRRAMLYGAAMLPVPSTRPRDVERILLIRPDYLGDVLLTTPAIQLLRAHFPNAEIHALVGGWSANILSSYDEIDHVLTLPFPGFSRTPNLNLRSPYDLVARSARHLRLIGYHSAIIFRPDHWWGALLAHAAGIPKRIGYNLPDVRPFLTHALEHHREHVVMQNARLVCKLANLDDSAAANLRLRFPVTEIDRAWVKGYLSEWGISPKQCVIAIHPGAGTWVKRWDDEKWSIIADTLADQRDAAIVFTGGDSEITLVENIAARMRHRACLLVGDAGISALAALYERADLVLGTDSGPLHLAAAVSTPTVTLFGPADPVEYGTWGNSELHQVLYSSIGCRPCRVLDWGTDDPANHPCVREISVSRVLEAAHRALQADR